MLRPDRDAPQVYLYRMPIDMRKQRNGLAALVQEAMGADPFGGAIFVFVGKRFDRIKILCWDVNGFVVWYKVIEGRDRFIWPRDVQDSVVTMSGEQLNFLLDGYDVWKMQPHKKLHFTHAR